MRLRSLILLLTVWLAAAPLPALPEAPEGWVEVRAGDVVLFTDAASERGAEIAVALDRFRSVFARLAPAIELRSPAPTKIFAFRDAESFDPYKTRAERGSARLLGQFLSHPDGSYITLDAGTRLVGAFEVIYHEYVHYFVRHNFPGVPLWFNEGLAEYYSTFAADGESAVLGRPVKRHLGWLERHGTADVGDILSVTQGSSEYHEGEAAGRFYALSWGLVHYLLSGESERLARAADLFLRLEAGEDPEEAFERTFDLRLSDLEDDLAAYLRGGELPQAEIPLTGLASAESVAARRMAPADVLTHLGDLLAHTGRTAAAERHFQLALDYRSEHPEAHTGLALVRDLESRFEEAEILYRDALRLGSGEALTHLLYGRHLLRVLPHTEPEARPARAERARDMLGRAMDLDPNYGEAHVLFGTAHLAGDADAAPGIRALERARELLPSRLDVVVRLAELLARDQRFTRARQLIEHELAPRGDPEVVERTRRKVRRAELLHGADAALAEGDAERALELFDEAISVTSDPELRDEMEAQLRALQERHGSGS